MQVPFTIERIYNAPASVVWQALTDKEQMKLWYFDIEAFRAEPGFNFSFTGKGHTGEIYIHHCKVTAVIPEKKLAYTWVYEGYEGASEVCFELFAEGNTTRLKLTHSGLETFPANNPDFGTASFSEGWTYIISASLKEFVEKNK